MEPRQAMRMHFDMKFNMATQLSDEDEQKPLRLKHVGKLFYDLYCESDIKADLDRAIAAYETAVRVTPDGHQRQAELLSHLGVLLSDRFQYFGDVANIDDAIFALEGSLILIPDGHADKLNHLNNLGKSLAELFDVRT